MTPDCRALPKRRLRPTASAGCTSSNTHSIFCISMAGDISDLPCLVQRKKLLEPLVANKSGLQFNGHETGDGGVILTRRRQVSVLSGVVSKTIDRSICLRAKPLRPMAQSQSAQPARIRCCWLVGPGRDATSFRGIDVGLLHR